MNLKEYLYEKRLSQERFANLIKYSRHHVMQVLHKKLKPGPKMIEAIVKATNGEVTEGEI